MSAKPKPKLPANLQDVRINGKIAEPLPWPPSKTADQPKG